MEHKPVRVLADDTYVADRTPNRDPMLAIETTESTQKLEDNVIDATLQAAADAASRVTGLGVAAEKIRERVGSKAKLKRQIVQLQETIRVLVHGSSSVKLDMHSASVGFLLFFIVVLIGIFLAATFGLSLNKSQRFSYADGLFHISNINMSLSFN